MLRIYRLFVHVLLATLFAWPLSAWPERSRPPNILLLLADDMGINDSAIYTRVFAEDGYFQEPFQPMPALETLADEGVRFLRFYSDSTCSASRAALITGQHPMRNGFMPVARGLSEDVQTLPDFLRSVGYRTHHVGKWHIGEINQSAYPSRQGFDSSLGFLSQWMLQGPETDGSMPLRHPTYLNPWLVNEQGLGQGHSGHLEDVLTEHTVSLINERDQGSQPWFIYHAFFSPHSPYQPPEAYIRPEGLNKAEKRKALLRHMDSNLNKIFDALKASGQWDNTIIIFASDNGAPGEFAQANEPFSGEKGSYDEGGVRVPLVVKWHRDYSGDQTALRRDVVSIMDIYPSLYTLLGGNDLSRFDGLPTLLHEGIEEGVLSARRFFSGFSAVSFFTPGYTQRFIRVWDDSYFSRDDVLRYDQWGYPEKQAGFLTGLLRMLRLSENPPWEDFLAWKRLYSPAPVNFHPVNDGFMVTGMNFIRTPVNPNFTLYVSFKAEDTVGRQILLEQKDILGLYLDQDMLWANLYGMRVEFSGIQPDQCYSVFMTANIFDHYSTVHDDIIPSTMRLAVNGKEKNASSLKINSLEKINIDAPTHFGYGAAGEKDRLVREKFRGSISKPVFYGAGFLDEERESLYRLASENCTQSLTD